MPTYSYECDACGHLFDHFQSIKDEPLKKCPKCKKAKLRRLLGTGAAIVFKGSGFYQTDYRSESYKKSAAAEKPATESSSSDSAANSDKPTKADSPAKSESSAPAKSEKKGKKAD